jgi:hypothetical protein
MPSYMHKHVFAPVYGYPAGKSFAAGDCVSLLGYVQCIFCEERHVEKITGMYVRKTPR